MTVSTFTAQQSAPRTIAALSSASASASPSTKITSHIKPITLLAILAITLCIVIPTKVLSLRCLCNTCLNNEEFCDTTPDKESMCFMSVTRDKSADGSIKDDTTYGCFSADSSIHFMQCRASQFKHTKPTYIKCCNQYDYCNENITEPTITDDPRWAEEPEFYDYRIKLLAILCFCLFLVAAIIVLIRLAQLVVVKRENAKEFKGSFNSIFKIDLERKLNQSHAGSSISTQYSVSEEFCDRPVANIISPLDEMSLSAGTGTGDKFLTKRTLATIIDNGVKDHVGSGRFGRVFRSQYHGEDVAVKAFQTVDQYSWQREDDILRLLNHDNVVRFIASEVHAIEGGQCEIWMFLEFCSYGSLCDYLDHNEILGPQQAIKILYTIINGLNYLHEDFALTSRLYKPSIAHRDIKSKNILMKAPDSCCIADFGHALVKLDDENLDYGKYGHLQVGTIRFMAPEMLQPMDNLNYKHFSTFSQADLYQFGLISWEVCNRTALDILHPAGKHLLPYDGIVPPDPSIADMIKIVCEDQYRPPRHDRWEKYPMMKSLSALMPECWRPNPSSRMETLGVKKRLRELYNQVMPAQRYLHQLDLYNNFSLSPSYRTDRSKSSDVTL